MSRKEKSRIDTSGGNALGANAFDALGALAGLPSQGGKTSAAARPQGAVADSVSPAATGSGGEAVTPARCFSGRVDVRREKSGRGGKTVTVIAGEGIAALAQAEREALLRQLKNQFGCGGSLQGQGLELQGSRAEQVVPALSAMGWRVVRAGG